MNPHYHPYGGPELTSPHPPSPDNNNYPGHPGPGGPHGHPHMHPSNGHGIGPLATTSAQNRSNLGHDEVEKWSRSGEFRIISQGHPGGPHDQLLHPHHQPHPAFSSAGPPPGAPHHPHNLNNNNNNIRICAGCGGKIVERFLLHALDRYWHNSCLKCSCCGAMLADLGTSCFTKSGMILCKNDYTRIFGGVCSACGQMIAANELVMRSGPSQQQPNAHVFHVKCFTCSKCSNNLVPGDRYYMLDRSLVCEQDWHKLVKSSAAATAPVRKGKVGRPRRSRD